MPGAASQNGARDDHRQAQRTSAYSGVNRGSLLPSFWTLQLLGWSGYYVAMAFSRVGRFPLSYMLAEKALLTTLGILISLVLRALLRRMMASGRELTTLIVSCVVAAYVLAAVWTALANVGSMPIEMAFLGRSGNYLNGSALFGGTVYNSFTLVAWGFLYIGLKHYARAMRAETMVVEARLRALQYQLNPHLFFNTLNAISTLVAERRNDDATKMIARLGDFLRTTLRQDAAAQVPLADELALTTQYLDIEQVRFGDRLRVTVDVDEDAYRGFVPVMLLQPLIENATRHGIARLDAGGTISITGRVVDERLALTIENSGPAESGDTERSGIGLANVRERLSVLYGARQSMTTSALAGGGFRVRIEMPFVIAA
jgi:two-component system, LytTR family, sensor kinase